MSAKQEYPAAEPLPLPINIDPTESTRFSPQRARDITSTAIAANIWNRIDVTVDSTYDDSKSSVSSDPHVASYDCSGAVSLNSSMQSNVPSPFGGMHKFTHLNMPGGQWEQSSKWMSQDLNSVHYINLRREARKNWSNGDQVNGEQQKGIHLLRSFMHGMPNNLRITSNNFACVNANVMSLVTKRHFSDKKLSNEKPMEVKTQSLTPENEPKTSENVPAQLSAREKLKKAVKDYGVTVIVFHVGISLVSLGFFYQLVARYVSRYVIIVYAILYFVLYFRDFVFGDCKKLI